MQGKSFYAVEGYPVCPPCVDAAGGETVDDDEEEGEKE